MFDSEGCIFNGDIGPSSRDIHFPSTSLKASSDKSPKSSKATRAATDPSEYGRTENQSPNGAGPSAAPVFNPQATLPAFYDTVSRVKELLNQVDTQKLEMMELHDVAKKLTKTPELQEAQKDMASLVMNIKKNLSDADKGIKSVQKSNEHDFVQLVRCGWRVVGIAHVCFVCRHCGCMINNGQPQPPTD